MNILFFGSHKYSLYSLEALYKEGYKICGVVTQPDRPVGRQQVLTPTPVKKWARDHKITVFTPEKLTPQFLNSLITQLLNCSIDLAVLCVYGQIIPKELLNLPKYGFLNIHPSLLPKYRGTAPVQAAIIMAEKETGVTIIKMDERLDHGPIIAQEKEKIRDDDTVETLYYRLFKKGADLLIKNLSFFLLKLKTGPEIHDRDFWGQIFPLPLKVLDDSKSSYTRKLNRDDGFIPWEFVKAALEGKPLDKKIEIKFITDYQKKSPMLPATCYLLHCLIRGLSPWPGAWSNLELRTKNQELRTKRLKLLRSHLDDGRLILDEVQIEGEKPTSFKNLAHPPSVIA